MGFTVVELLAALAVVAVLVGIIIPVLGYSGEKSRSAKCVANLHGIGVLFSLYAADHQLRIPTAYETVDNQFRVWHQELWFYAGTGNRLEHFPIFRCPSQGEDLYSYAFERRASKAQLANLIQDMEGGKPTVGKRWLVMDSSWYFLERSHGVNGATGTARITAFRHQKRANFLFPDFSVASLDKHQINHSLYNFKEYPIP